MYIDILICILIGSEGFTSTVSRCREPSKPPIRYIRPPST